MWLGRRFVIKTVSSFKRFCASWNNTKEFREYLVDGKFLNLTYGPFTSTVATTKKDVQSAQALVYKYFKEAKWEWEPDNPTGFRVLTDCHGVRYIKDNFEQQAVWLTIHEKSNICGVVRLLFKFETHEKLDIMNYIPRELKYGKKQLKDFLKAVKLIEPQRFYVLPAYRGIGIPFMLRWCMYRAALIGNVDGMVIGAPYNFLREHRQYKSWDFDYGDGFKTNLYFLHKAFFTQCVDYHYLNMVKEQKKLTQLIKQV